MRTISLIAAGLAGGLAPAFSAPAMAQDPEVQATFTGPRVEGIIGWDKSRSGSSVDIDNTRDLDQSIDGFLYGVGLGYDFAVSDQFVVGAEAELSDSTAKVENDGIPNVFNLGRVDTGRDIYAGARVGFITGGRMLIYAKGGYTNGRYTLLGTDGTTRLDQRIDADGYRVGGGVEYALNQNTFAKLEYRYSNYSRAEFDFDGDTPDSSRFDIDTDRHQIVVGVGFRF